MDSLYRENILDHYKNPRNFGRLVDASTVSEEENPGCGDRIKIQVKLVSKEGQRIITDIRFSGEGCAITIASASLLTESVKGKRAEDILKFGIENVVGLLGTPLTPARVKCALLPLEVIHKTLLAGK